MDIKQAFIDWTYHTVSHGNEDKYLKDLIPKNFKKDTFGNYYHIIGNPDTIFTSHLDTVVSGDDRKVNHVIEHGLIKTDGSSTLGADDKAGVVLMLFMIEHNIPGLYIFFLSEENGCVGSGNLTKKLQNKKYQKIKLTNENGKEKEVEMYFPSDALYSKIRKVISFDRMGYDSIITHQMGQRCCSDIFAKSLADELNHHGFSYTLDETGTYSDSAEFADIYPECTNISVGYFGQHTVNETQDIEFLEKLANTCVKVNWNNLIVSRDPRDIEYIDTYYTKSNDKNRRYIYDDKLEGGEPISHLKEKEKDVKIIYFYDEEFNFVSDVSFLIDKIVDINLSEERLKKELDIIEKMFYKSGIDFEHLYWDGLVLVLESNKNETKMIRDEIIEFIPELSLEEIPGFLEEEKNEK